MIKIMSKYIYLFFRYFLVFWGLISIYFIYQENLTNIIKACLVYAFPMATINLIITIIRDKNKKKTLKY